MRCEPKISAGLGGYGPEDMKSSLPLSCRSISWIASEIAAPPANTFVRPGSRFTPKTPCRSPRRRSASINSVLMPCCVSVMARFAAVVDLPSCGSGLVKTMILGGLSGFENVRLVRRLLYASETGFRGSRPATSRAPSSPTPPIVEMALLLLLPFNPACRMRGIMPRMGAPPVAAWMSSRVWTVSSMYSRVEAMPTPNIPPRINPSSRLSALRGLTGSGGRIARSTTRTLTSWTASRMRASWRRCCSSV